MFLTQTLCSECKRVRIEMYRLHSRRTHPVVSSVPGSAPPVRAVITVNCNSSVAISTYPRGLLSRRPAKHDGDNTEHAFPGAHCSSFNFLITSFITSNISRLDSSVDFPYVVRAPLKIWSSYLCIYVYFLSSRVSHSDECKCISDH